MATTMGVRLTHAGQKLLAKVHAGIVDKLELTSIVIGDGIWTEDEIESPDKTKLKSERIRTAVLELTTGTGDNAGRLICSGVLNNITVTKHFYVREIGIMAKDPDEGEILYIIDPVPANAPTTVIEANSVRQDVPVRMELVAVSKDKVELVLSEATSIVTPSQMADAVTDIKAYVDQKTTNINAFTLENKRAADFAAWEHKHSKSEITDFPSSLPAKGGHADTAAYAETAGNADTAKKFTIPRKINGVDFNGTKDISLSALDLGFDGTFDACGWCFLPSGLIMQWGSAILQPHTVQRLCFPVTFPSSCLQVVTGHHQISGHGNIAIISHNNSTVSIFNQFSGTIGARYFAVGY